jgi:ribosomal-protein-alanine N-acetyltransferase
MKKYIIAFVVFFSIHNIIANNIRFPFAQPAIQTIRLILEPLAIDHVESLFTLTSDPEVAKYTSMFDLHSNKNETLKYIQKNLELFDKAEVIPWIVFEKVSGKIVGFVRFLDFSILNARAEIGYAFVSSSWNKGYATEAAKALIDFGFKSLNLIRIQATVDPKNFASNRVLEKCGMHFEGILRDYKISQGIASDRKMYAIIKKDLNS